MTILLKSYHISSCCELEISQRFNCHPPNRKWFVMISRYVVVLLVDVSGQTEVCHFYDEIIIDTGYNKHTTNCQCSLLILRARNRGSIILK